MLEMLGDHGTSDVVKAQALKDATMAHFIGVHARKGIRFLHFNGSYHSDHHEGIAWYLERGHPELNVVTIATSTVKGPEHFDMDHRGQADIILLVDEDIPGSY